MESLVAGTTGGGGTGHQVRKAVVRERVLLGKGGLRHYDCLKRFVFGQLSYNGP